MTKSVLVVLLLFCALVVAHKEVLELFKSRRGSFSPQKREVFPGDDKLKDLLPQFQSSARRHKFSVKGLETSSATVSLSYDIISSYSFRYLESIPGVQDVAYDERGLYVLLDEGTGLEEFSSESEDILFTTQMEWSGALNSEDSFHTKLPTGSPELIWKNVVFIPSREVNLFDVAHSAKIDCIILPHSPIPEMRRATYNASLSTPAFNWNYDDIKKGAKGLLQYGPAFKCLDCYITTSTGIVFQLDYAPSSLNPIPKLNALKVMFDGSISGKYAIVLGPGAVSSFNQPAIIPTFVFFTLTVAGFPVTFSGSLGINIQIPTITGVTLRANSTFQAAISVGYQQTGNGTAINTFSPSIQYSAPRFNFTTNAPGHYEVHIVPSIYTKWPSTDATFDMTFQMDPWVALDVYSSNATLCPAGGAAFQVKSGYKMNAASGGMTYQGSYIMPKVPPTDFILDAGTSPACSFCRGCTNPNLTTTALQPSTPSKKTVLIRDSRADTYEYGQWYTIQTTSQRFEVKFQGHRLDPENIANVVIFLSDNSDTQDVKIYASQRNKEWTATDASSTQELTIPISELSNETDLNIAFTSSNPTSCDFIVFLDVEIGLDYGKPYRLGDFGKAGFQTISFEADRSGDALSGILLSVQSDSGIPNIAVQSDATEDEVWQGGNPGQTQNIFMYQWQINLDDAWDWETYYEDPEILEFSGTVFAEEQATNVSVVVAPFVEISMLNSYASLKSESYRFYFLIAVDPQVDEIWVEYDNQFAGSPLEVSHRSFNMSNKIPYQKQGDEVPIGDLKDFKFRQGKISESEFVLGVAYSEEQRIDVDISVYFVYPLYTGIPFVSTDVNSTFDLYRLDLLDGEQFPGRGATCNAVFTEPANIVALLTDFENLTQFTATNFTSADGGSTWQTTFDSIPDDKIYIYVQAQNGSSYSLTCTFTLPIPTSSFEIDTDSLGTILFDVSRVENRYYRFPKNSLLELYPLGSTNPVRLVSQDFGISSGYGWLSYLSLVADLDTRTKKISSSSLKTAVSISFKLTGLVLSLVLDNKEYQWDYDLLMGDLNKTLLTIDGGNSWKKYVGEVLKHPSTYLLAVENNQKISLNIQPLKRPTHLSLVVPDDWVIPKPEVQLSATKRVSE